MQPERVRHGNTIGLIERGGKRLAIGSTRFAGSGQDRHGATISNPHNVFHQILVINLVLPNSGLHSASLQAITDLFF